MHIEAFLLSIPFVGILLSMAVVPAISENIWHKMHGRIIFVWVLLLFFIMIHLDRFDLDAIVHNVVYDYIPFISLISALFVICSGILIRMNILGTPIGNVFYIFIGTVLSGFIGTTGASVLLIHTIIAANFFRQIKMHTIIFFIFLVANIGGIATPLGDPPLLIGFLKGVDFFWPLKNLFLKMFIVAMPLLFVYFIIDSYLYHKKENKEDFQKHHIDNMFKGKLNIMLLLIVIASLFCMNAFSYYMRVFGFDFSVFHVIYYFVLVLSVYISIRFTNKKIRDLNEFSIMPIVEPVKLFLGIFITITPIIGFLKMGHNGPFAFLLSNLFDIKGDFSPASFFWHSGLLSGFLDNTPTYLIFFNIAGGDPNVLMGQLKKILMAISFGSVFMGALTYIGNAPNLIVKNIASHSNIKMPGFFTYFLIALLFLVPLFFIFSILVLHN